MIEIVDELKGASAPPLPGRREANKADKVARIRQAARDLFAEKGFDAATLREIAARAEVGFGTLFDYASNKRDLLFLIYNPDLALVLDEGYAAAGAQTALLDKLLRLFESFYALFQRDPRLARYLLRELNFYSEGAQADIFLAHRAEFRRRLAVILGEAQSEGLLGAREPAAVLAEVLFALFAWEVRRWISEDEPALAPGLAALRALIRLQLTGFAPAPGALARG